MGVISNLVENREHLEQVSGCMRTWESNVYILMARIRKDNDWETAQARDSTSPSDDSDWSSISHCVSFDEVANNQNDQVSNRNERDDTGVL